MEIYVCDDCIWDKIRTLQKYCFVYIYTNVDIIFCYIHCDGNNNDKNAIVCKFVNCKYKSFTFSFLFVCFLALLQQWVLHSAPEVIESQQSTLFCNKILPSYFQCLFVLSWKQQQKLLFNENWKSQWKKTCVVALWNEINWSTVYNYEQ